ncbi:hypothetical protein JCM12681A_43710 [Streptomyces mexicanus]
MPAEASTTTDSVVAARMAQRGRRRGTEAYGTRAGCGGGAAGVRGPRRCGAAGDDGRGGVVDMGDTSAYGMGGHREHRRAIRSAHRCSAPAARIGVPRSR